MTDYVLVLTTLPAQTDAIAFARSLVDERLAACVNVHAEMDSVYRWRGAIEQERERQVFIKTRRDRVSDLERRLESLHPYEVPELIVIPLGGGSEAYLGWLEESTRAI